MAWRSRSLLQWSRNASVTCAGWTLGCVCLLFVCYLGLRWRAAAALLFQPHYFILFYFIIIYLLVCCSYLIAFLFVLDRCFSLWYYLFRIACLHFAPPYNIFFETCASSFCKLLKLGRR